MANEKRLIDANALTDACRTTLMVDVFPNWQNMPNNEKNVVIKLAGAFKRKHNEAPTVDAVEVVHGRWIKDQLSKFEHRYNCSACNYRLIDEPCNYCPNCGAKMDGGNEDV